MKSSRARRSTRTVPKNEVTAVRARAGLRHDLWFAHDGLYRVEVLRGGAVGLSALLPVAAALALANLPRPSGYDVAAVYGIGLVGSIAAAFLIPSFIAARRRRLSTTTLALAKAQTKTKKIPWDEVKSIVLTRKTVVRLELGRGRFTRLVRASISERDANQLKDIVFQSGAEKRLDFRDGIFK